MSKGILDNQKLELPCPQCKGKTAKTVGWIKAHSVFRCVKCGRDVELDKKAFMKELSRLDSAVKKLF
jgi:transposase-like protein